MTQEARRSMVWLEWIEIRQFRGVKPGTRLEFNPGFNVLLGRNGTGKTTLLELCAAVLSGDFSKFEDEEFDLSARIALGDERLSLSIQGFGRPYRTAGGRQSPRGSAWRFEAAYTGPEDWSATASPDHARIHRPGGEVTSLPGSPFEGLLYSSVVGAFDHPVGALGYWLLRQPGPLRFDEGLGLYARLFDGDSLPPGQRVRVHLWRQPDGKLDVLRQNFPSILIAWDDASGAWLDTVAIGRQPWLVTFEGWIGAKSVSFRLHRTSESVQRGMPTAVYESPDLQVRVSDHLLITHRDLSFGQKRLFAFIYLLALDADAPLIADELVNGLHHSWIQDCIDYLSRPTQRQAILASQSPLLVDHLEFQSAEQTRSTFILCTAEDDAYQWCQMTASEADEFFGAYEIGIEHVGEILRNRGLW